MTDKELRHLSRKELLEILLDQTKEINMLRDKVQKLESDLNNKRVLISESGTLSEAVLALNNLFADADNAAKQYLDNARMNEEESIRTLEEARRKAKLIIEDAELIQTFNIVEGKLSLGQNDSTEEIS